MLFSSMFMAAPEIAVYKENPAGFPATAYVKLFEREYGQTRTQQTDYVKKC